MLSSVIADRKGELRVVALPRVGSNIDILLALKAQPVARGTRSALTWSVRPSIPTTRVDRDTDLTPLRFVMFRREVRAQLALSELEQAGRIVRVRTRRDVWFMVPDDAADLITEAQEMTDYHQALA